MRRRQDARTGTARGSHCRRRSEPACRRSSSDSPSALRRRRRAASSGRRSRSRRTRPRSRRRARRLVEGLAKRGPLDKQAKHRAGELVHFGFGAAWGGLYGLVRASYPRLWSLSGVTALLAGGLDVRRQLDRCRRSALAAPPQRYPLARAWLRDRRAPGLWRGCGRHAGRRRWHRRGTAVGGSGAGARARGRSGAQSRDRAHRAQPALVPRELVEGPRHLAAALAVGARSVAALGYQLELSALRCAIRRRRRRVSRWLRVVLSTKLAASWIPKQLRHASGARSAGRRHRRRRAARAGRSAVQGSRLRARRPPSPPAHRLSRGRARPRQDRRADRPHHAPSWRAPAPTCWPRASPMRTSTRCCALVPAARHEPLARAIVVEQAADRRPRARHGPGRLRGHERSAGGGGGGADGAAGRQPRRAAASTSASPASIGCSAAARRSRRPRCSSSSPAWRARCRRWSPGCVDGR